MRHGTAQFFCRDFFRRNRFDDSRAGEEHIGRILDHEDEVHQGRAVNGTAGTGPHDDGQLGNDAGRRCVVHKNSAKAGQGIDAFLNASAAGIIDTDDRCPTLESHFLHLSNLMGMHFAKGSAFNGKIFGIGKDQSAPHRTITGNDAVTGNFLFLHAEMGTAMMDKLPHFRKAAFIKQLGQPFAGRQLSFFMLRIDSLLTAAELDFCEFFPELVNLFLTCSHSYTSRT